MATLKLNLSVELLVEEDGGYSSFAHEIGVASQGDTPAEAEAYLKEAVELTLEDIALHDLKYAVTKDVTNLFDELGIPPARQAAIKKARQKIAQDIDKAMLAESQSLNGKHPTTTFKLNYAPALVNATA